MIEQNKSVGVPCLRFTYKKKIHDYPALFCCHKIQFPGYQIFVLSSYYYMQNKKPELKIR